MLKSVSLDLPYGHPFLGIGVASFTLMKGVEVVFEWQISPKSESVPLLDLFRCILTTFHRQPPSAMKDIIPATLSFPTYNCCLISSCFVLNVDNHPVYYIFGIFMQSNRIPRHPEFFDFLTEKSNEGAKGVKEMLETHQQMFEYTRCILKIAREINVVMKSGIKYPLSFPQFFTEDAAFYSLILKCHLSTQMVTIIEAESEEEAKPVFNFLSNFLLKHQADLSSITILDDPVPCMYLQCVSERNELPLLKMLLFKKSWTWIKIKGRQVFMSPEIKEQKKYNLAYTSFNANDNSELGKKIKKHIEKYSLVIPKNSIWADDIVANLLKIDCHMRYKYCQEIMQMLVLKGLILIEYVSKTVDQNTTAYMGQAQIAETKKILEVESTELYHAIVVIADLFDHSIYYKVNGGKNTILYNMISTM